MLTVSICVEPREKIQSDGCNVNFQCACDQFQVYTIHFDMQTYIFLFYSIELEIMVFNIGFKNAKSRLVQGGKSETSVLPILPRTPFVLPWYSLVVPRTPSYFLILPRTSSYFLVIPRTSWYSLVLPRTPPYSLVLPSYFLRTSGVRKSRFFPLVTRIYLVYS
jgi:hypothetical protein